MLTVKLEGFEELQRKLADAPRKLEIATQRALLKTAHGIREAETAEMQRVFKNPTRWTLGAMKVKATNKMTVEVGIIDPDGYYKRAASYLGTQVGGGQRRVKAMEKSLQSRGLMPSGWMAVPGQGAKMDAFGNMSVGQIRQILSWFDAAENWAGSTQNMGAAGRAKRMKGTRSTAGFEYFAVAPGARRAYKSANGKGGSHSMQPGIYSRTFLGHGSAIKPVLIFVKSARYQIRFNFESVAKATADAMMNAEFNKAVQMELLK
jgi:hypothetical protein